MRIATAELRQRNQGLKAIVQLVRIAHVEAGLFANFGNGSRVETSHFGKNCFGQSAAHFDGAGAAFFERGVVEVCERIGVENFVGELRRHGCVYGDATNRAIENFREDALQAGDVHRFGKRVFHDFANERVIGNAQLAFEIFRASGGIGKNGSEKIVRTHALDLRRDFFAALESQEHESARGVPTPARREDRRGENGLLDHLLDRCGMQKSKHIGEGKAVLLGERDIQAVVGGGSLQFKIEGTAESFPESEAPGFIDAASEGGVDDELHAAAFVEEAFGDDRFLCWDCPEHRATRHEVFDGLLGARVVEAAFFF